MEVIYFSSSKKRLKKELAYKKGRLIKYILAYQ